MEGDTAGNLVYRKTARNFNPMIATADGHHRRSGGTRRGRRAGPGPVHTPGIYVDRIVGAKYEKRIEFRTTARRGAKNECPIREQMASARRAGAARRLLRQPRHRHPDAGRQPHSRRHQGHAAVRERSARHRGLSRPRMRSTPISSTPASRPSPACRGRVSSQRRLASR